VPENGENETDESKGLKPEENNVNSKSENQADKGLGDTAEDTETKTEEPKAAKNNQKPENRGESESKRTTKSSGACVVL